MKRLQQVLLAHPHRSSRCLLPLLPAMRPPGLARPDRPARLFLSIYSSQCERPRILFLLREEEIALQALMQNGRASCDAGRRERDGCA